MSPIQRDPEHAASAWSDVVAAFRQPTPHRMLLMLLSVAIPGALIGAFVYQFNIKKDYEPPEVIYVKIWPKGRTEAQVEAQQKIDAPREIAERKAEFDAEEARKAEFRKLAEKMGIDVDK